MYIIVVLFIAVVIAMSVPRSYKYSVRENTVVLDYPTAFSIFIITLALMVVMMKMNKISIM